MHQRIVIFDLGETLASYTGVGLNWSEHYAPALAQAAASCGLQPSSMQLHAAQAVLARFNTRLAPREHEVSSTEIFAEALASWRLASGELLDTAAEAFFGYFRSSLKVYPDTRPTLEELRRNGRSLAVFTDVPYGMPKRFVEYDLESLGILRFFDHVLTSVDVGLRKPHPAGLQHIATLFGAAVRDVAYVGNEPKDVEAARRAGVFPILIDRAEEAVERVGLTVVRTLEQLLSSSTRRT